MGVWGFLVLVLFYVLEKDIVFMGRRLKEIIIERSGGRNFE